MEKYKGISQPGILIHNAPGVGVLYSSVMGTGYLLTVLVFELICKDSRPVLDCQLHKKYMYIALCLSGYKILACRGFEQLKIQIWCLFVFVHFLI